MPEDAILTPAMRAASEVALESSMKRTPSISATRFIRCGKGVNALNAAAIFSSSNPATRISSTAIAAFPAKISLSKYDPLQRGGDIPVAAGPNPFLANLSSFFFSP